MKKVLIIGGIGSGKSTICQIFKENYGVPVYDSDSKAKEIVDSNPDVRDKIKEAFGEGIYEDKTLNRKKLAEIVFSDKKKLKILESIVHPHIYVDFEKWFKEQNAPYVIQETAANINMNKFDFIIVVEANEDIRIKRVMSRDECTEKEVRDRMDKQFIGTKLLHYIIENDWPIMKNAPLGLTDRVSEINNDIMTAIQKEKKAEAIENASRFTKETDPIKVIKTLIDNVEGNLKDITKEQVHEYIKEAKNQIIRTQSYEFAAALRDAERLFLTRKEDDMGEAELRATILLVKGILMSVRGTTLKTI